MKIEIAKKWIEALRSGVYKKAVGALKKVEDNEQCSYCALGVLCDIYQKENGRPLEEKKINSIRKGQKKFKVSIGGQCEVLPNKVRDWAGMSSSCGYTNISSIPHLNDGTGGLSRHSFKEIADLIEKNIKDM